MKNNQYCQWRRECQNYITKSAKQNILARLNKIECIVNQHGQIKNFKLPCDIKNKIITDINNAILSWRGIEHESCKKIKKSLKEYKKTAVNWFNRNKSKIFGRYLFFPVIFGCILQFCCQLEHLRDNTQKMIIFIEIFSSILKETIQFKKTKCQPIIPYQTLVVHNTFKQYCNKLVQHFDTIWDLADISPCKISSVYQKDKGRSKKTSDSFIKALMNIHNKLQSVMDKDCYTLFSVQLNNVTQDNKNTTQDKATLEKYERIQMKQESDSISSSSHLSDVMLNNNTNNDSAAEISHSNSNVGIKQQFNIQTLGNFAGLQPVQTNGVPVHVITNGAVHQLTMVQDTNAIKSISLNQFSTIERDAINNRIFGYQIEKLNGDNGPIVVKQYLLFPNQRLH